ncbi:MAG: hypothetical protein V3U02_04470 [Calditrichia bacterium]
MALPISTTFSPGDPATGSKMNENKTDLETLFKFAESDNISYTWGVTGEVATAVDNERSITYTYTWEDGDGAAVRRVASITDGTNTWTISYDANDRPTSVIKS